MVRKHHDIHFRFLGGFQNLSASPLSMVGIFGVDVENSPKIAINPGRRRRSSAFFHPFDTLRMNRFQMRSIEPLNRGAGKYQSGNSKEGKDTHTFILILPTW